MTLNDCPPGTLCTVIDVLAPKDGHRHRLMELGLVPGTDLWVVRRAPFGDPLVIHVRGVQLGIRRKDARFIQVETERRP
ncbi:FeoA family protein [Kyrpidia spormannii]|uniref:FeoA family protein n=2 Tax=Kyrpidia spormannii TaxID=2055160 RepID=A0ACA8ZBI2_9BACL|nr:FeoA family protein [Kyrpidia spormannii]CAB3394265.1 FeoA family protein [Kyrpidia spormannii]CAB3395194.1 Ferrous iron transport protein A [Kyrpidia spormannii]